MGGKAKVGPAIASTLLSRSAALDSISLVLLFQFPFGDLDGGLCGPPRETGGTGSLLSPYLRTARSISSMTATKTNMMTVRISGLGFIFFGASANWATQMSSANRASSGCR